MFVIYSCGVHVSYFKPPDKWGYRAMPLYFVSKPFCCLLLSLKLIARTSSMVRSTSRGSVCVWGRGRSAAAPPTHAITHEQTPPTQDKTHSPLFTVVLGLSVLLCLWQALHYSVSFIFILWFIINHFSMSIMQIEYNLKVHKALQRVTLLWFQFDSTADVCYANKCPL